ncbi:hypothetical protein B0H19DRAFT_1214570 [Mycena capillaripes]|nr:hypothetical protein B0H19DRAFT_1214570 [Mycena capillaripes]
MFPGPHEPTAEQYNNVMRIVVRHFKKLYNGVNFDIYGQAEPEPFHVQIGSDVSDLPASRKTSGLLACTSKYFMCDKCDTPFYALIDPDSFDSTIAEEISRRRGVRYSVLDELVNWLPGDTGLIDPMHCIFGAIIKHLCRNVLFKNGMIDTDATQKIEEFFESLIWPPFISRLPPSWRSLITVFFVALFMAWQIDGEIPDEKLFRARMRENLMAQNPDAMEEELEHIKTIKMDRSLRRHYDAVVQFTAAIRIITSNSISPDEIKRGCGALERTIQEWARMYCHLVLYLHLAVHLEPQYYKHGLVPGWWTYPYERNNGFLGRFNHNGHAGGEMEGTMMRGWWKATLIQDLVSMYLIFPPISPCLYP